MHRDDRARYSAITQQAAQSLTTFDIEYKIKLPNNEIRLVREIGEPETDENGKLVRMRGTLQDVTERFRLLEELQRRESELKQAQRIGQIGHWILDLKTQQFEFWSDQLYRIFGVDKGTFNPTIENFKAAIHPDDLKKSIENRESALSEKRPYLFEYRIFTPDGETRVISGEARPEFDNEGNPTKIFGVTQDVTETRQRDLALFQAQKMEAVGQLTGGVAHDFNNLLAVIQGNTELLMARAGPDKSALQAIMRAAESGAALTDSLLAFARQQPLDPRSNNIAQLVDGMAEMLFRTLGENISVQTDISPDLWPVLADYAQLEASILNLAINARDAMPGGGHLTITCKELKFNGSASSVAELDLVGDFVGIFVADDGRGIPQAIKEKVFNPFFTTKEVGQGSGLGLSMVYGFAKQSGGHVAIESEPGQGTTVALYLPRALAPPPASSKSEINNCHTYNDKKVLIIEDNSDVRTVVSKMAIDLGLYVVTAADAMTARQLLADGEAVDIIISDVILPEGLSGPDFAREVSSRFPHIKTLFMSGYPAEVVTQQGLLESDAIWLKKPFSRQDLTVALRSLLDQPVELPTGR
ncbi:MAG: PAS domain-containing protein [Pseudomonadota bacterium]